MTTIVVEDGTIVSGANSFVTMAEYIAYAATLNITVTDTQTYQTQIIKAAEFIATKESQLKGDLVSRSQELSFPRYNLMIEGFSWESDEIPTQAKEAQMSLAIDINAGEDLYNLTQSVATGIKRERVDGAVEVEYAVDDSGRVARNSRSQYLLSSLMEWNGLGIPIVMA